MFFIGIVGDRKRGGDPQVDVDKVREIIDREAKQPGPKPVFVSIGCDMGIGKAAKDVCKDHGYPFLELSCMFHQFGEAAHNGAHVEAYLARNAALYQLCQVFHLFARDARQGIVENLIRTLRNYPKDQAAVMVYDEAHNTIETIGFPEEGQDDDDNEKA